MKHPPFSKLFLLLLLWWTAMAATAQPAIQRDSSIRIQARREGTVTYALTIYPGGPDPRVVIDKRERTGGEYTEAPLFKTLTRQLDTLRAETLDTLTFYRLIGRIDSLKAAYSSIRSDTMRLTAADAELSAQVRRYFNANENARPGGGPGGTWFEVSVRGGAAPRQFRVRTPGKDRHPRLAALIAAVFDTYRLRGGSILFDHTETFGF